MADKVIIVAYDPQWPQLFSQLGAALRAALGETARRIDHIGSTAIPSLDAKPILDIQISVAAFEPLEVYRLPLEGLGYIFREENPERTKRYFREGPGQRRTHLHVRRWGSWPEQFALLFRDYLRMHPDEAKQYAALKYALAEKHGENRDAYTEAKTPFVWEVIRKADRWSQETGWEPGASDA
ncbi:MAG: GrpB family protein [Coprothermobacterota bacterium]|nr:GrpB family protein [Coprothermobacterota bacterium]